MFQVLLARYVTLLWYYCLLSVCLAAARPVAHNGPHAAPANVQQLLKIMHDSLGYGETQPLMTNQEESEVQLITQLEPNVQAEPEPEPNIYLEQDRSPNRNLMQSMI